MIIKYCSGRFWPFKSPDNDRSLARFEVYGKRSKMTNQDQMHAQGKVIEN